MGILELVQHEKEMRRLFGQQELKIIEKQLLGVNLSPSEKTRLSRDIKPKFKIILKLFNFENEFSLKKSQEIRFLIEMSKDQILSETAFKIKNIFVFGSYISKEMRLDSNIDMAVEFYEIDSKDASKFKLKMTGILNRKVQISVFNVLPKKIKKEVLNNGKAIYEDGKS